MQHQDIKRSFGVERAHTHLITSNVGSFRYPHDPRSHGHNGPRSELHMTYYLRAILKNIYCLSFSVKNAKYEFKGNYFSEQHMPD